MKEFFLEETGASYRTNQFRPGLPILLFVHGLSGSASAWIQYEKILEPHYNLVTYDLRGHGTSIKSLEYKDYAIERLADDIYRLAIHLHIEKFVLVSHSFGTIIALEFLREHGEMVSHAIFLAPVINMRNIRDKILGALIQIGSAILDLFPFHPKPGIHINYSEYLGTGDWSLRRMAADIPNTTLRIYLYCLKQIYKYPHYDFWHHLEIPVLIVHGKRDTPAPLKNSLALAQELKNVKITILKHADHMLVLNNSPEVCDAIQNFLNTS